MKGNDLFILMDIKHSRSWSSRDLITRHKYLRDCPRDLHAFPVKISDFLIPCPELIKVSDISICHV